MSNMNFDDLNGKLNPSEENIMIVIFSLVIKNLKINAHII